VNDGPVVVGPLGDACENDGPLAEEEEEEDDWVRRQPSWRPQMPTS